MTAEVKDPTGVLVDLRREWSARRAELEALVPSGNHAAPLDACGLVLGRKHARVCDELLTQLFEILRTEAREGRLRLPGGEPAPKEVAGAFEEVALGGVGGYGRGALALGSDLDVRLLARDLGAAASVAEALLYPLWDMGVTIGHQVGKVEALVEAARTDLPTATSLLDYRHITGSRALSDELKTRCDAGLFAHTELPRFLAQLEDEVRERHARFGGSVYLLEPDVKNGAGGLRDLDIACWAGKARFGVHELDDLVRVGALLPRESAEIAAARELLFRIRNLLHAHAGRRSDRLTFDEQESIASLLGYGEGGEAVEKMMSAYYRSARIISSARETMLARAAPLLGKKKPREEDLGGGVRMFDGCVTMSELELVTKEPALALRMLAAAVERRAPLLPWARDAIARAAADPSWTESLRESPEAARLFCALVSTTEETRLKRGSPLAEMHDLGLLLAMIPEFLPVVGRVHHDVYHVYTVDVHSVAAVDRLAALVRGELTAEHPLACRLAAEATRKTMLFFATLLHDVGKAIGGKDHSERGAVMADGILKRLGLPAEDVAAACHLVRQHLVMYHVATRRDLDDPATIEEFLRVIPDRDSLSELYLLTVADLSTTSPTSMTSWKARMLDELYLAADRALAGNPGEDERSARAQSAVLDAALALPASSDEERAARQAFVPTYLASMPERYLLSNAPAAIASHAELARKHEGRTVSVALVPSRHPQAAEICVVAADRPGLLASITAALAASRLEVHAAQIHSRHLPGGAVEAVDLFWVRDRAEGVEGVARALPVLVRDLDAVLEGRTTTAELASKRGKSALPRRATPRVRTQVSIDDRASPRHTVLEVMTRDRPGLLHAISDALYRLGLSIVVAKINTEGMRAADVFYVSEADGGKVAPGKRAAEVRQGIESVLESLEQEGNSGPWSSPPPPRTER
ncbi:[protein-PII] uridylyltransferase [Polyangium fumosum]|uniref:Bifunctional uridylyltransferase/uridylyl-removing enzyme n=1 Tax=Polyangium fumosum TaxID=889272 RepID=A0A4U1JHK2_9BACT|nr:[protein-PII] uridylyltransferase [Polyangium fumosum]TKD12089.1 [protein-PII] uridylyltransferase [Polyangium fumosum]